MNDNIRSEIVSKASAYIVVNDGQFVYPVLRTDLRDGDEAAVIKAMDGDEYGEWCNDVPADLRVGNVGSQECIDLCDALIENGAVVWDVA